MVVAACSVCGGEARPWHHLLRCRSCGFSWVDPMPSPGDLARFYDAEPLDPEWDREVCRSQWPREFYERRLDTIERSVAPGALLDVGVGFGHFLAVASARWPAATGLDLACAVRDYVRRHHGLEIDQGSLRELRYAPDRFDCIHMKDVIEHVPDPVADLRECARILRPGGVLVVETLNIDSIHARMRGARYRGFIPGHVSFFGPVSLRTALRRAGLAVVAAHAGDEVPLTMYRRLRPPSSIATRAAKKLRVGDLYVASMVVYARRDGGA